MVEELSKDLYRIEIPLSGNPLKSVNCYVIKGAGRNLIIDTGWNQRECQAAMEAGLMEIGVDVRESDFFITHIHSDHLGMVSILATKTSKVYFNRPDAERIEAGISWDSFVDFARINGFPEEELQSVLQSHPGFKFRPPGKVHFEIQGEGDTLSVSDYLFRCIETPGHARGHLCLYEPNRKILVSGDHILNDITPNIQLWSDDWNPLKEYLESLDKIHSLDIELVLPGHRSIFRDCRKRIQELKDHHSTRLEEILSILRNGKRNAYQVASEMSWDIVSDSWDLFPVPQKWFATGEAISHLKYLEEELMIHREVRGTEILFSTMG
jgi:glyoxylase-like metal-dependent hydrolase (beta-lactamase superfamily II)